ncbi:MAG: GNAT family N-acetyltransferase [Rhodobacteraceae bacterium]|jgi:GNAT superfamily N-acetyltransferase|nr:GNAT family N-acetyltransferase [Paracoccaceae bacterium]
MTRPSVAIRPLIRQDEAEWRRLWHAYLAFYQTELPDAVYAATFAGNLDPAVTDRLCLVAEGQGRLVGLVHVIWHAHNWRLEDVCYLQDLYVDEGTRGTGAGRALIEAVYAEADRRGTPAVYWMTQDFNTTARRLYDRVAKVTPFVKYTR